MKYPALRREIVAACQDMNRRGINQGTSGNISARVAEGLLITPSGLPYDEMKPADVVLMKKDGSHAGRLKPSSEWRFHTSIMATRSEVGAVVHTHSMFATTLSCLGLEIPAVHYMIAAAGGNNIRCVPYITYGTQELADAALKALEGRNACLLANHGMIVVGPHAQAGDVAGRRGRDSGRAVLACAPGRQAQHPHGCTDQDRDRKVPDLWSAAAGDLLLRDWIGEPKGNNDRRH
jgi:L-fuculose-phosphate aldolase